MENRKIYLDPRNKWCITIEQANDKGRVEKHYMAIPPTNGDRVDIYSTEKLISYYNYDVKNVIVVLIKNGEPKLIIN